jgi:hypothetical protein
MTCAVCGAQNEASAAFCYRCGSALKAANTSSTGPTVNLGRSDTPPFGNEAVAEESSARVYDVPETGSSFGSGGGGAPVLDQPANQPQYVPPQSNPPQYNAPQYGSGQPYAPYGNTSTMPQQSNTALIAMILGIVAWLGPSLLTAIPAVILGRNARNEIRRSNGMLTGDGMAQAGIILGWIHIGLFVAACACFALFFATGLAAS